MLLGPAEVRFTGRAEGDLGHGGRWVAVDEIDPAVADRRRAVHPRPWSWLRQVHGADVVRVEQPGGGAGSEGDAAVTSSREALLCVLTADCAPVALAGESGVIGVAHAGWRGIQAGVLETTVAAMRSAGEEGAIVAALGPCIRPGCYEFGRDDLDEISQALGSEVVGVTASGHPALDVPAAVRAALSRAGVESVTDVEICTACDPGYFSHRARRESQRQATLVWLP